MNPNESTSSSYGLGGGWSSGGVLWAPDPWCCVGFSTSSWCFFGIFMRIWWGLGDFRVRKKGDFHSYFMLFYSWIFMGTSWEPHGFFMMIFWKPNRESTNKDGAWGNALVRISLREIGFQPSKDGEITSKLWTRWGFYWQNEWETCWQYLDVTLW